LVSMLRATGLESSGRWLLWLIDSCRFVFISVMDGWQSGPRWRITIQKSTFFASPLPTALGESWYCLAMVAEVLQFIRLLIRESEPQQYESDSEWIGKMLTSSTLAMFLCVRLAQGRAGGSGQRSSIVTPGQAPSRIRERPQAQLEFGRSWGVDRVVYWYCWPPLQPGRFGSLSVFHRPASSLCTIFPS
jgi:hypothetical protein